MLVDTCLVGRRVDGTVELPGAEMLDRVQAGEQLAAVEHLALSTGNAPPDTQAFQQHR